MEINKGRFTGRSAISDQVKPVDVSVLTGDKTKQNRQSSIGSGIFTASGKELPDVPRGYDFVQTGIGVGDDARIDELK